MSGILYGNETYFYPENGMTRAEFTVTLLTAAGIAPDEDIECNFADKDEIPASARAYVAKACEIGLSNGWIKGGEQVFEPNREITLAEAARMTARLLGIEYEGAVPVSVGGANYARYEIAVLCSAGFGSAFADATPNETLTRAAAAEIICGVLNIARAGGVTNE